MLEFYQTIPYKINPTIFEIGFLKINYYWLMYLVGLFVVLLLLKYRIKKDKDKLKNNHPLKKEKNKNKLFDLIFWMFFGAVLGGRLGYVLLYDPLYFFINPIEIINPFTKSIEGELIFRGIAGMSFHGGLIGSIISSIIFLKFHKLNYFKVIDFIIPCIPLGYFWGRIGNFLNGELWGRSTNFILGMYFPKAGINKTSLNLRHPSQLYEAVFEGLISFIILWKIRNKSHNPGFTSALYLILYSFFRFFIEFARSPDEHIGLIFNTISIGQIYSLLMLFGGIILLLFTNRKLIINK